MTATTSDGPATTDAALAALAAEAGLIDPVQEPSGGISFMVAAEDPSERDDKADDGCNGNEGVAQMDAGEPMQVDGDGNFIIPQVDGAFDLFLSEDENKDAESDGEQAVENVADPPVEDESQESETVHENEAPSTSETTEEKESSTKEADTESTAATSADLITPDSNMESENAVEGEINPEVTAASATENEEEEAKEEEEEMSALEVPSESDMQVDLNSEALQEPTKPEESASEDIEPPTGLLEELKEDEKKEETKEDEKLGEEEPKDETKNDDDEKEDQMDEAELELKLPKDDSELEDECTPGDKDTEPDVLQDDNEAEKAMDIMDSTTEADDEANAVKLEKEEQQQQEDEVDEPMDTDPLPESDAVDNLDKDTAEMVFVDEKPKDLLLSVKEPEAKSPVTIVQKPVVQSTPIQSAVIEKEKEPETLTTKVDNIIKIEPKEAVKVKNEPVREEKNDENGAETNDDSAALTTLATAALGSTETPIKVKAEQVNFISFLFL